MTTFGILKISADVSKYESPNEKFWLSEHKVF